MKAQRFSKRPRFTYIQYFLMSAWSVLLYFFFRIKKNVTRFGKYKNITLTHSSNELKNRILSQVPFAAIRFGAVELSAINNEEKIRLGFEKTFKPSVVYSMKNNTGFFPTTQNQLHFYTKLMTKELIQTDVLGISGIHMEEYFYDKYCPHARVIQYESFEPLRGDWVKALQGKKVLVISPFAKDIEKQHAKRHLLFQDNHLKASFSLTTIEAVQTLGQQEDQRFDSWFEALDAMKLDVLKKDFDIALVGAGSYGSPLCWFIKSLNKQAIQTGGATPTLFGIMGKRWEKRNHVARHMNEHWIRPSQKPRGADQVEQGAYW
jgi:hypothetical protein